MNLNIEGAFNENTSSIDFKINKSDSTIHTFLYFVNLLANIKLHVLIVLNSL